MGARLLLLLGLAFIVTALGQTPISPSEGHTRMPSQTREELVFPVSGAPLSADQVTTRSQITAEWAPRVQSRETARLYRDSTGRIRAEFTQAIPEQPQTGPFLVIIRDYAAGMMYALDPHARVAYRLAVPKRQLSAGQGNLAIFSAPPQGASGAPQTKSESLGDQTIEGFVFQGSRTTKTWPASSQADKGDLVSVEEIWFSRESGILALHGTSDSRSGDSITKLENIHRTEPDPVLFEIPADYTIQDLPLPSPQQ
jgi:hypothetical protein